MRTRSLLATLLIAGLAPSTPAAAADPTLLTKAQLLASSDYAEMSAWTKIPQSGTFTVTYGRGDQAKLRFTNDLANERVRASVASADGKTATIFVSYVADKPRVTCMRSASASAPDNPAGDKVASWTCNANADEQFRKKVALKLGLAGVFLSPGLVANLGDDDPKATFSTFKISDDRYLLAVNASGTGIIVAYQRTPNGYSATVGTGPDAEIITLATPASETVPAWSGLRKPAPAKKTITCIKGKTIRKVTGTNPKCPAGYRKK